MKNYNDAIKSAAEMGDADAVRQLLEAGASPDDDNVLRDAIEYGRTDIVRMLLDAGADVHANKDYARIACSV